MVINKVGDLLTDKGINVIAHQANLFHTFGSGIARIIKGKFPEAYEADKATPHGDALKLGMYSTAISNGKTIVNVYSQTGMGATDRNTSYNDIYIAFSALEKRTREYNEKQPDKAKHKVLGVPYKYGSGLAGGKFRIVNAIFEEIFGDSPVTLYIVRLEDEEELF